GMAAMGVGERLERMEPAESVLYSDTAAGEDCVRDDVLGWSRVRATTATWGVAERVEGGDPYVGRVAHDADFGRQPAGQPRVPAACRVVGRAAATGGADNPAAVVDSDSHLEGIQLLLSS